MEDMGKQPKNCTTCGEPIKSEYLYVQILTDECICEECYQKERVNSVRQALKQEKELADLKAKVIFED